MLLMGKIVDEYKLGRINNTVSFFFFFLTEQKRTRAKLCLWIYDQNVELIPTVLTIEINRN